MSIVVVDDDAFDRRAVSRLLEGQFEYEAASSGAEALARLPGLLPRLVLLDLMMPRISGLDLVREIRQNYPHIATVLMTSRGSEEIVKQALLAGATSYLSKIRLKDQLVSTLQTVLSSAENERVDQQLAGCIRNVVFEIENDPDLIPDLIPGVVRYADS